MKLRLNHPKLVFTPFLAAFWAGTIAVASLLPADRAVTSGLWDKIEHCGAFALLALLILFACPRRSLATILLAVTTYGGLIELAQFFSPGRFPDLWDGVANFVGASVALLLAQLWRTIRVKRDDSFVQEPSTE
tara:strand:- start:50 stop:448 length:399 start_codon:yes stop_codon:yes gene_type:complete